MFGWTLLGGAKADVKGSAEKQFLLCTGQEEFEKLCAQDVLGLVDDDKETEFEHEVFKGQLIQGANGYLL